MHECPRCHESVDEGAQYCPRCGTDLRVRGARPGDVILVLDRGLVQFGKFALVLLGIFLVFGAYVFGLDLKDLVAEMQDRREQLEAASAEILEANDSMRALETEMTEHADKIEHEMRATAQAAQASVAQARQKVEALEQRVAEAEQALSRIRGVETRINAVFTRVSSLTGEQVAVISAETRTSESRVGVDRAQTKLFAPGTRLTVGFLSTVADETRAVIVAAAREWQRHANLEFVFVEDAREANIRIGFSDPGSWSYLGRDALEVPAPEPTMNFGFEITGRRGRDVVLSQFGHAIGFPNEHQNPREGIEWDEAAVIRHFVEGNGWNRQSVEFNILRKVPLESYPCSRPFDPDSIMTNTFPAGLTRDGMAITPRPGLSESDKACAREMYPR